MPLFWSRLSGESKAALLEPEDAKEDELTVSLELDESVPLLLCDGSLTPVPVAVALFTREGYENHFAAELPLAKRGAQISVRDEEPVTFTPEGASICEFSLEFSEQDLVGRFCDEERGVATFPTPCDGLAQAARDEAPFAETEAPADWFANFEQATLSYPDLPPLTLTMRIDDATACYDSASHHALEASVEVETGGARFEAERVPSGGFFRASRNAAERESGSRTSAAMSRPHPTGQR